MLFFVRDTYPDVLQLMLDRSRLPQTWDEWHGRAQAEFEDAEAAGQTVVKVEFDVGEFLAFCIRSGLGTNEEGRRRYVALKVDDPNAIKVAP